MTDRDATIARAVELAQEEVPEPRRKMRVDHRGNVWLRWGVMETSEPTLLHPIATAAIEAKIVELDGYTRICATSVHVFGEDGIPIAIGNYTDKLFIYSSALCKLADQMGETK